MCEVWWPGRCSQQGCARVALSEEVREEPWRPRGEKSWSPAEREESPLRCRTVWLGSSEEALIMLRSQSDG